MNHQRKISVIGVGYVGFALVAAFSRIGKVIAYDKNPIRIGELKNGLDRNEEISVEDLDASNILYTTNSADLSKADFHIIAVPTPINKNKQPDLSMLLNASEVVGQQLKKGDIVVYESTVYPGTTEEKCLPVLKECSKLICGKDFTIGYSPERINPADKEHLFHNIIKIISASDKKTLDIMSDTYKSVVSAGVFPVSSIRVAEATKIIENIQRDINIAFMNDITILLHTMGIETAEVISAMKTKWNFQNFQPGLVSGHCLSVNSYYLMHIAEQLGYYSDLMIAGRRVNESISKFIVDETIKKLIYLDVPIKKARIAILGLTYKKNCPDLHDTKVIDIINGLKSYDINVLVHDPIADPSIAMKEYNIALENWENLNDIHAFIVTVAHNQYVEMDKNQYIKKLKKPSLIMDINEIFDPKEFVDTDITIWRL